MAPDAATTTKPRRRAPDCPASRTASTPSKATSSSAAAQDAARPRPAPSPGRHAPGSSPEHLAPTTAAAVVVVVVGAVAVLAGRWGSGPAERGALLRHAQTGLVHPPFGGRPGASSPPRSSKYTRASTPHPPPRPARNAQPGRLRGARAALACAESWHSHHDNNP